MLAALLSVLFATSVVRSLPSILFVLVDDLGAADVSFNAERLNPQLVPSIHTPVLDGLAKQGAILSSYYTHLSCGPSRSALLTGRSAAQLGNVFPTTGNNGGLHPGFRTVAHELQVRGYSTHIVGKWSLTRTQHTQHNTHTHTHIQNITHA
jgi:arylsulfatase A-like enzyme